MRLAAPCLLFVPAAIVHSFSWHPDSSGFVMTLAVSHLNDLLARHPDLSLLFAAARVVSLPGADYREVQALIAAMGRELGWNAPGQRSAIEAALLSVMIRSLRLVGSSAETPVPLSGHHAAIVARFHERVEARFRLREPVAVHAAALGISPTGTPGNHRAAIARTAAGRFRPESDVRKSWALKAAPKLRSAVVIAAQ